MKTPITVRIDTDLLLQARRCASSENRTLTNFIETVLCERIIKTTRIPLVAPATKSVRASKRNKDKNAHVS